MFCLQVLLATCHDPPPLEALRKEDGNVLAFDITAQGSVQWRASSMEEAMGGAAGGDTEGGKKKQIKMSVPKWCANLQYIACSAFCMQCAVSIIFKSRQSQNRLYSEFCDHTQVALYASTAPRCRRCAVLQAPCSRGGS